MYQVLLYYKYVNIDSPVEVMEKHRDFCQVHNITGRVIVSDEGINGTLEGTVEDVQKYVQFLDNEPLFANTHFKYSDGTGSAFPKLSIKVRKEIVSGHLGTNDVNPNEITGKYISPEELHQLIHSGEEFYMIDMRNDYEHKSGFFKNAVLPELSHFRDLPKILPTLLHLKDKKVVTYCTGGVRCEKASGFLVKNGFSNVYQLYGGIHSYMERYPNQDFLGKLYVFDGRITMGFNIDSPEHTVVGKCDICEAVCDEYANCAYPRCNKHIIACKDCRNEDGKAYCSEECKENHIQYKVG